MHFTKKRRIISVLIYSGFKLLLITTVLSCSNETSDEEYSYVHSAMPSPFHLACYSNPDTGIFEEGSMRFNLQAIFISAREQMFAGGNLDTALYRLTEAEFLIDKIPLSQRVQWSTRLHIDRAFIHMYRKAFTLGKAYAHRAISESIPDTSQHIDALLIMAHLNWSEMNYNDASKNLEQAESLLNQSNGQTYQWETLFNIRANNFNNLKDVDSTTLYANLNSMGLFCGDRLECLAEYERLTGFSHYLNYYMRDEDKEENLDKSVLHVEKFLALKRLAPCANSYTIGKTFELLARIETIRQHYEKAVALSDSSLFSFFGNDPSLETLKSNIFSIHLLSRKAEAYVAWAKADKDTSAGMVAFRIYRKVEKLIGHFSMYDRDTYMRNNLFNNFFHTDIIRFCAFMYDYTKEKVWLNRMLGYIGSYKSEALRRDAQMQRKWSNNQYEIGSLLGKIGTNDQKLESLIHNESITHDLGKSEDKCQLIEERRSLFLALADRDAELYAQLVPAGKMSITNILKKSKRDSIARLYYYIGSTWYNKTAIYCIYIYDGSINLYQYDGNPDSVNAAIDTLYHWHSSRRRYIPPISEYADLSNKVYRALIGPVIDSIKSAKYISILPDHAMSTLAFDALVTNTDTVWNDYVELPYLLHATAITSRFSVEEYSDHTEYMPDELSSVTGMAWTSTATISDLNDSSLPELRSSKKEMEALKLLRDEATRLKIITGYECTRRNFFKYAPGSDILHLTVHGIAGVDYRLDSKLYFRQRDTVSVVYPHELMYKGIHPQLVVLSACETGAFSIGRAFYIAGARNVISSNWVLSDNVANEIFPEFYDQLYSGSNSILSLNNSKKSYLNNHTGRYSFPGYWACLVHQR